MGVDCCRRPMVIYNLDTWKCENCGTPSEELNRITDVWAYGDIIPSEPEKICQCGADKLYGPNNNAHSSYMPCPLYKRY